MLAAIGFIATSIFFAAFAATFESFVLKNTQLKLRSFTFAYYCLALAFAVWGVAAAIGNNLLLEYSVVVGDGLLLIGTLYMIATWLHNKWRALTITGVAVACAALLLARLLLAWPEPYVSDGVLIFNSHQVVRLLLAAVLTLIWLPINIRVARQVAASANVAGFNKIFMYIYTVATVASIVFLFAERTFVVILSFAIITVSFAMLLASNIVMKVIKEAEHAK